LILLKKDRLIKAISLETGGAGAISCLDEYGNVLCAKGGGVFLDLSRGFTMARVGKGSSTSRSTDVEDLRELIRKAARTQDLLARAGSLVSADDRFSVVDSPFSNTIWVRSKGDTEEMPPFRVEIKVDLIRSGRVLVRERMEEDLQTRREVEALLGIEEEQ